MENLERILELSEKLNSLFYNFGITLVGIFMSLAFLLVLIIVITENESDVLMQASIVGFVALLSIGFTTFSILNGAIMRSELEVLNEKALASIETTAVLNTKDIVNSIPVLDSYCPTVELKEYEVCTYLEFISDSKMTQLFVPLDQTVYASAENELAITYYVLSEEEREFLNHYYDVKRLTIDFKHVLHPNNWSLGVSIETE